MNNEKILFVQKDIEVTVNSLDYCFQMTETQYFDNLTTRQKTFKTARIVQMKKPTFQ